MVNFHQVDSLKIDYISYDISYEDEEELFYKIDSLTQILYGEENISIKMLYDRYIDINDCEYLVISKIRILSKNRNVIKIKIKKCEDLEFDYHPKSPQKFTDKVMFLHFIRIG
jgi:hypothetical protein